MNSFTITDKFKDQSNYLVAFLASVIGLGAFKDSLSNVHIDLFNKEPSLFNLAVPLVVLLLASVYLSALALLADNLNAMVPLKGYLSLLANVTGAFALLAPMLFLILWGVSVLAQLLSLHSSQINATLKVIAILLAVPAAWFAYRLARNNEKRAKELDAFRTVIRLRHDNGRESIFDEDYTPKDLKADFLKNYEDVSNYVREYLDIEGYGVKNMSLPQMSKILVARNVFVDSDLEKANSLLKIRNDIAHNAGPKHGKLSGAFEDLFDLEQKIIDAFWRLISEQEGRTTDKPIKS